jgi:serine/threonine protein kinase
VRQNRFSPRGDEEMMDQQVARSSAKPRLDEVDVLTSLRGICPNVVQLLDVFETHQEVQLVLEYCEGGDLFDCIKRRRQLRLEQGMVLEHVVQGDFMEGEVCGVARTLLGVLETLHSRHIVHRDIKPENILLVEADTKDFSKEDDGGKLHLEVKLTDFGLARILKHENDEFKSEEGMDDDDDDMSAKSQRSRAYSRVGSDYYTAPEVNMGFGYDTPVDMYSLGVTLYVMLCGAPPSASQFTHALFKLEDDNASPSATSDGGDSSSTSDSEDSPPSTPTPKSDLFPPELNISSTAQDFICKMIHPDPERRITASDALKHEWITQHVEDQETRMASLRLNSPMKHHLSSSPREKSRALSSAEAEAILRIPIQGSLHEIAPPVIPPSNSPKLSPVPAPPTVSVTLANVCSKLGSLVEEQRIHKHRRHHRFKTTPKKHQLSAEEEQESSPIMAAATTPKKKVRVDLNNTSPSFNSPSCANNRICRRFNSPGSSFIGPVYQQQTKGAN